MELIYIIITMALLSIIGALGSLLMKKGSSNFHIKFTLQGIWNMITNWHIVLGAILYLSTTIVFIWLLKQQELSLLYPLTSITYISVTIFSVWILKEKINTFKIFGIFLIILGVILVTVH